MSQEIILYKFFFTPRLKNQLLLVSGRFTSSKRAERTPLRENDYIQDQLISGLSLRVKNKQLQLRYLQMDTTNFSHRKLFCIGSGSLREKKTLAIAGQVYIASLPLEEKKNKPISHICSTCEENLADIQRRHQNLTKDQVERKW